MRVDYDHRTPTIETHNTAWVVASSCVLTSCCVGCIECPYYLESPWSRASVAGPPTAYIHDGYTAHGNWSTSGYTLTTGSEQALARVPIAISVFEGVWSESYTIRGCNNKAYCGVFVRVPAHCKSGGRCGSDSTACDGAPVYQLGDADGPVLFRQRWVVGSPYPDSLVWVVATSSSSVLSSCDYTRRSNVLVSGDADPEHSGSPIAAIYTGTWLDRTSWPQYRCGEPPLHPSLCGITVVAGGER